jgi:hypothetical protein
MGFEIRELTAADERTIYSEANEKAIRRFAPFEMSLVYYGKRWLVDSDRVAYFAQLKDHDIRSMSTYYILGLPEGVAIVHIPEGAQPVCQIEYITPELLPRSKEIPALVLEALQVGGRRCVGMELEFLDRVDPVRVDFNLRGQ